MLAAPAPGKGLGHCLLPACGHLCLCGLSEVGAGRPRPAMQPSCSGCACQHKQAGQAQAAPGSAPHIACIHPSPIPTPCITSVHSAPIPASPRSSHCPHLSHFPSLRDLAFTPLPCPHCLCLPPSRPHITCICTAPIRTPPITPALLPASPAFALLTLPPASPASELQEHLPDGPDSHIAHLPASLHPLLPPCFAPALQSHPAAQGSQQESSSNIVLSSPRTPYGSRRPRALQTQQARWHMSFSVAVYGALNQAKQLPRQAGAASITSVRSEQSTPGFPIPPG